MTRRRIIITDEMREYCIELLKQGRGISGTARALGIGVSGLKEHFQHEITVFNVKRPDLSAEILAHSERLKTFTVKKVAEAVFGISYSHNQKNLIHMYMRRLVENGEISTIVDNGKSGTKVFGFGKSDMKPRSVVDDVSEFVKSAKTFCIQDVANAIKSPFSDGNLSYAAARSYILKLIERGEVFKVSMRRTNGAMVAVYSATKPEEPTKYSNIDADKTYIGAHGVTLYLPHPSLLIEQNFNLQGVSQ